jgi:nitroimidazol reductase NimA-like FMN-containing flavoprotein (pyridoxamine 5'-phosphate oxidase superfamily)
MLITGHFTGSGGLQAEGDRAHSNCNFPVKIFIFSGRGYYTMDILKIPRMQKQEYDKLIRESTVCRIAFRGDDFPYIAPFMYVFDGKFMYFLSTRYGRKIDYFRKNPAVSVEVDSFTPDMSCYTFMSLQGILEEVPDATMAAKIRQDFVDMIRERNLSLNVLAALGYSPDDPPDSITRGERTVVWKLTGVRDIVALKNG